MSPEYGGIRSGPSTPREPPSTSLLEKHFLEEAKKGASNGSRYDLRSPGRIRPPAQTDMADSMSLHLLVSTAILDSSNYEILSFDEVEALKSEFTFVNNRIDAAKRKLVLESKVRDAAQSLGRLRSRKPGSRGNDSTSGRVTSIGSASSLGPSSPGSPSRPRGIEEVVAGEDDGLAEAQRKCDAIAAELWSLSLRSWDIQKKLMQHDAGVLGMTHNGSVTQKPALMGGILSNPHAINGKVNGMMSPVSEDGFDSGSSYRRNVAGEEGWDVDSVSRKKGSRPGTATVDGEVEKTVEALSQRLKGQITKMTQHEGIPVPAFLQTEKSGLKERLAELEDGLKFLENHPPQGAVPAGAIEAQEKLERTNYVLSNLWNMLRAGEEQVRQKRAQEVVEPTDYELSDYDSGEDDDEELGFSEEVFAAKVEILHNRALRLREAKKTLERKITNERKEFEEKISRITEESDDKVDELKVDLKDLEYQVEQLTAQKDQKTGDSQQEGEKVKKLADEVAALKLQKVEMEEVTNALKMSLEEANEQMDELREDLGMAHDKSDGIAAERDQLKRQLEEMEDRCNQLNDELLTMEEKQNDITEQLYAAQTLAKTKEEEAKRQKDELEAIQQQLEILKEQLRIQAETAIPMERYEAEQKLHEETIKNYEIEFGVKDDKIAELFIENENLNAERAAVKQELEMVIIETETRLKTLEDEIKWLKDAKKSSEAARDQTEESATLLKQELEAKDKECEELESEIARISMELAMLKAEHDELKGSKSQRAAEAAALQKDDAEMQEKISTLTQSNTELTAELAKIQEDFATLQTQNLAYLESQSTLQQQAAALQQQNTALKTQLSDLESKQDRTPPLPTPPMESLELEARCQTLQNELNTMLVDFEALTKLGIEHESERRALEAQVDALRDKLEHTETLLNDERVRMLGGSGGSISGPVESRSTTVLKTEFKKMMRDMRAEQAKQLRAEQEERRKLEATIRQLKKDIIGSKRTTTASMASALRERLDRDVPPTPTISHHGAGFGN